MVAFIPLSKDGLQWKACDLKTVKQTQTHNPFEADLLQTYRMVSDPVREIIVVAVVTTAENHSTCMWSTSVSSYEDICSRTTVENSMMSIWFMD